MSFNIVAKNDRNVEATFDFAERTKFYDKLVRHCCRFWQQSQMLLRHCLWCGRGLLCLTSWRIISHATHTAFIRNSCHSWLFGSVRISHNKPKVNDNLLDTEAAGQDWGCKGGHSPRAALCRGAAFRNQPSRGSRYWLTRLYLLTVLNSTCVSIFPVCEILSFSVVRCSRV